MSRKSGKPKKVRRVPPTEEPSVEKSPPPIRKLRVRADSDEELRKKVGEQAYRRAQTDPNLVIIRQGRWPGRNDPCHCGSGRKFKRCCMSQAIRLDALDDDRIEEPEPLVEDDRIEEPARDPEPVVEAAEEETS